MAIIDSVRKLAEKVGADTNGRTIADQLNIINQKLDNTQPGSRDIAEAVSKFADKEDGTATFMTKNITENNTYNAADDGVSGYSSVTVNVASNFNILKTMKPYGTDLTPVYIRSSDGIYNFNNYPTDMSSSFVLIDPVIRVINSYGGQGWGSNPTFTFTPAENYDGFYSSNSSGEPNIKFEFTGDEVTSGDGKTYSANLNFGPSEYTMTYNDDTFVFNIT